ncbi:hypothetical protein CGLO_18262 [Colletotrichum gloeosporioides Cg-14]|uniref:Uncharacterized protein n=1 Tax=Colletotrichum gloeosporioides (strain Cg-14) TaxID=1237896 RepID=T0KV12_COLGC|nr:hypothetical protein CGLO_18262 [Colletotrichum gloeosporioides Cg-14]
MKNDTQKELAETLSVQE